MKAKLIQNKSGAEFRCDAGVLSAKVGCGWRVKSGNAIKIARIIQETAEKESWAGAEGSFSWQLEHWAKHIIKSMSLFTVADVIRFMSGMLFDVLHVKEYTQNGFRVLLIQAENTFEDDRDEGGQMYFFVFNGHAWVDVSEAGSEGLDVKWHKWTKGAIFYSRTEKE